MLIGPQNLAVHVNHVRSRINRAAQAAGRDPASVTLIAVTKAKPAESRTGGRHGGRHGFRRKLSQGGPGQNGSGSGSAALHWHFIGGMQSNKTRAIAERFEWVHSVDRLSVARRLSEQRPFHAPAAQCVHPGRAGAGADQGRGRTREPRRASAARRPNCRGCGCGASCACRRRSRTCGASGRCFARLRILLEDLNATGLKLDTLSMGMSADFESAIAEGATHVRIGTAIFGSR